MIINRVLEGEGVKRSFIGLEEGRVSRKHSTKFLKRSKRGKIEKYKGEIIMVALPLHYFLEKKKLVKH